jgi:hypothetical protein
MSPRPARALEATVIAVFVSTFESVHDSFVCLFRCEKSIARIKFILSCEFCFSELKNANFKLKKEFLF